MVLLFMLNVCMGLCVLARIPLYGTTSPETKFFHNFRKIPFPLSGLYSTEPSTQNHRETPLRNQKRAGRHIVHAARADLLHFGLRYHASTRNGHRGCAARNLYIVNCEKSDFRNQSSQGKLDGTSHVI